MILEYLKENYEAGDALGTLYRFLRNSKEFDNDGPEFEYDITEYDYYSKRENTYNYDIKYVFVVDDNDEIQYWLFDVSASQYDSEVCYNNHKWINVTEEDAFKEHIIE